ncbi:unnamed protein product [Urochloa decumbens]|uniref:FBD domain-containing protein n=1 Tax=Urochloa decumbens TaxID=240449 RepID=A0ABC9G0V5_9POAL
MEARFGRRRRRLGAPPPRGSRRRCLGGDGDGDGVDRISGLNDDLLIQVLVRLRCAGAAARTSVLSRRWRDLWKHLPELSFRRIAPEALEATLAQVAVPKLSLLDIDVFLCGRSFSAEGIASLLRTAARLDPVEISIVAWVSRSDELISVEVPSFARATSITLRVSNLHLTLPAQGCGFPVLERLSMANASGRFDTGALVSRCPKLRVLEIGEVARTITVHSATIEELLVTDGQLRGVDIVAPMMKKFTLRSSVHVDFTMSLLAPKVENLLWKCWSIFGNLPRVAIDGIEMWCLNRLELKTVERVFTLVLDIGRPYSATHMRNLQEMFQFPNISVLELSVETRGHVYGAMALNLLRICNAVRRLKLVIKHRFGRMDEVCPSDCPCNQPQDWRSQNISLMSLTELEIEIFKGRGHEVDFLKLLFRCAPLMNVTLKLASKVVLSSRGCKETNNIFKANPAAECHVYRKRGKEVIFA